ncbi:MAG: glycosyltransferase family 4 protein [Salinivirgaceae bacterium]
MRILILSNKMRYPPKDGGYIALLSMARAFAQLGHEITLLAMNTHKHNFDIEDLPEKLKNEIDFHTVYVDTSIKPPEMLTNLVFSRLPYNAKRFVSTSFKQKLVALLRNNTYDIVQLEGLYLYPYISIIRKHFSGKVAFRAHNIEHEIWRRSISNQQQGIKRMYMRTLTRRLERFEIHSLNKFDLLVPITERDGHVFEFLGNDSPKCVAPVGVDLNKYNFHFGDNIKPDLAFIGSLDWMPNQEGIDWFLNKVWPLILNKKPDIKFHIAGRNAPPKFEHHVHRKNVVFHGEVDDALDYLNQYTYMIVPLLSGSGMRVKIVEGMATGRVVFTTSIGAEGLNAIDKTNILIDDDPDKMAESIVKILSDKEKTLAIAKSARQFIEENFDNMKIAANLIDFYSSRIN